MREPHERADPSLADRLAAVRAGFAPSPEGTEQLRAARTDPDPRVRAAALAATVRAEIGRAHV